MSLMPRRRRFIYDVHEVAVFKEAVCHSLIISDIGNHGLFDSCGVQYAMYGYFVLMKTTTMY